MSFQNSKKASYSFPLMFLMDSYPKPALSPLHIKITLRAWSVFSPWGAKSFMTLTHIFILLGWLVETNASPILHIARLNHRVRWVISNTSQQEKTTPKPFVFQVHPFTLSFATGMKTGYRHSPAPLLEVEDEAPNFPKSALRRRTM